jgi:glycosyltransferase involved in cell wall biosynthesis
MKISLCIPQYNRIQFLLRNLGMIAQQTYRDIEVVITDDASTDNTMEEIGRLIPQYKYPIIYFRHPQNVGYDANLRSSLERATGDYCLILGNDDSLNREDGIAELVSFLTVNERPEIGFCNYVEDEDPSVIVRRAAETKVIGAGEEVARKYYRSFSFVAGIIIRKDVFDAVNTSKMDGSIFVQIYFAARIISSGGRFFTYADPLVRKDLRIGEQMANSYRDRLIRNWKELKPLDGGMKNMAWAVVEGFADGGVDVRGASYLVLKNVYKFSYPYWLIDYRGNKALVAAVGMVQGLKPSGFREWRRLSFPQKASISMIYCSATIVGLVTPVSLFRNLKSRIYRFIKK